MHKIVVNLLISVKLLRAVSSVRIMYIINYKLLYNRILLLLLLRYTEKSM